MNQPKYERTLSQKDPKTPFNLKAHQKAPYLGKNTHQNTLIYTKLMCFDTYYNIFNDL